MITTSELPFVRCFDGMQKNKRQHPVWFESRLGAFDLQLETDLGEPPQFFLLNQSVRLVDPFNPPGHWTKTCHLFLLVRWMNLVCDSRLNPLCQSCRLVCADVFVVQNWADSGGEGPGPRRFHPRYLHLNLAVVSSVRTVVLVRCALMFPNGQRVGAPAHPFKKCHDIILDHAVCMQVKQKVARIAGIQILNSQNQLQKSGTMSEHFSWAGTLSPPCLVQEVQAQLAKLLVKKLFFSETDRSDLLSMFLSSLWFGLTKGRLLSAATCRGTESSQTAGSSKVLCSSN